MAGLWYGDCGNACPPMHAGVHTSDVAVYSAWPRYGYALHACSLTRPINRCQTYFAAYPSLPDWNMRSAASFSEALRMGSEVYHNLKNIIKAKYGE